MILVPPNIIISFNIELFEHLIKSGLCILISQFYHIWVNWLRKFPALLVAHLGLLFAEHAITINKFKAVVKIDGLLNSDCPSRKAIINVITRETIIIVVELSLGPSTLVAKVLADYIFTKMSIGNLFIKFHATQRINTLLSLLLRLCESFQLIVWHLINKITALQIFHVRRIRPILLLRATQGIVASIFAFFPEHFCYFFVLFLIYYLLE